MNKLMQRWMADATRLTRDGHLREAAEAIRGALAGALPTADAPADVIDVPAREVPTAAPTGRAPRRDGAAAAPGGMIAGRHAEAHDARDYRLYLPPAADGVRRPLLVMLHGCTQDAEDFARGTRMNDAAGAHGVAVLYPEQSKSANGSGCWNWFKHNHQARGRGEPALIAGMTRAVIAAHGLDPSRVYVAGLSAGGAMAAILGSAYPDLYAAIGVHSGLAAGAASDLPSALAAMKSGAPPAAAAGAPPTIVFHGDRDETVHPTNGAHALASSAGAHAGEAEQGRRDGGRRYTRRVYRDGAGRVVAEHWVVHGAGHAWAGGSAGGSYTDPSGPDASAAMLRFFLDHRLAGAH